MVTQRGELWEGTLQGGGLCPLPLAGYLVTMLRVQGLHPYILSPKGDVGVSRGDLAECESSL